MAGLRIDGGAVPMVRRTLEAAAAGAFPGGLLAAVSAERASACLAALRPEGVEAAVIGEADPTVPPGTIRVV